MAIKVGINGFGRIGRVVLRIMIEHPEQFDICGINLRKAELRRGVHHRVHRSLQHHREGLPPLQGRREEGHPDRARQG